MKVLSTLYYHVGLEELTVKEFDLTLERDPLAIATRSLRVTHFSIPSEKIRLSFNSMTGMKTAAKLPPRMWVRGSSTSKHFHAEMGLRWWRDVLILSQTKRYLDDR